MKINELKADNVLALIPNSQARDINRLRMKFLKTRDSAGVGSYVDFITEWSTLTFEPVLEENGGGAANWQMNANSNHSNEKKFEKKPVQKPNLRHKSKTSKKEDDSNKEDSGKKAASALRRVGGINKKKTLGAAKKRVKLV